MKQVDSIDKSSLLNNDSQSITSALTKSVKKKEKDKLIFGQRMSQRNKNKFNFKLSDEDEQEMRNTQFDPNNSENDNESYQDWIQQHFE